MLGRHFGSSFCVTLGLAGPVVAGVSRVGNDVNANVYKASIGPVGHCESRNNWMQRIAPPEVSYTNLASNPMDVRTTIEPRVLRLDRSRDVDTWGYDYDCTTIWAREALLA